MINNRWKKIERSKDVYLPTTTNNPIIKSNTNVCLMGSCFADEMGYSLAYNNINIGKVDVDHKMEQVHYPWGTFFSPMNIFDILHLSFNGKIKNFFDESTFIRVNKNIIGNHYEREHQIDKDEQHILLNLFFKARLKTNDLDFAVNEIEKKLITFKKSILDSEVIIITLGLIEAWVDKKKNKAWHSFHGNALKKQSVENLATFKQLTFEEVSEFIREIIKIINIKKNKRIIFTVSPIPLNFTFTNNDVVLANRYSKSVLRSALERFIDNKEIFYFPSFEIVQDCVGWPLSYKEDKRHIKENVFSKYIAPKFIETFTNIKKYKF
tara:strand:- start:1122 stop:2090 length:969 start_codon:yes stop_codon:yes gene_type:complete